MTRLRGWGPTRERVVDRTPHGHWKTSTLVAALGHDGMRASMLVDGAIDRAAFEAYVERVLGPTLRSGEIVVMDNLTSHTGPRVRAMIEARGAEVMYLPPYSPDLSPIEPAFSTIKQALRSQGWRTLDELWSGMQGVLDLVTPDHADGYFRHCGYSIRMEEK